MGQTGEENGELCLRLDGFHDVSTFLRVGVYALAYRGVVVYVGKSKNMLTRVYTHRSMWSARRGKHKLPHIPVKGILFDEVHVQPCSLETIDEIEQAMIRKYKPKYNVKHKGEAPVRNIGALRLRINGLPIIIGGTPPPSDFVRRI